MTVSIIIAVKGLNPNLLECIERCLELDYPDFEILVLPDGPLSISYPKITVIPTGPVTPPIKRDLALEKAKGQIIAFLDDDAYPVRDWLSKAIAHFENADIAAVGGPALTPDSDSLRQKASGRVYGSFLVSGLYAYRYLPKAKRFVDDYPSCNFIVRKSILREISGFNTKYWPGEDTFLCLKIVRDLNKKIVYDPAVLAYHHRRSLFKGHLRQIANYALHRGYFVKKFPGNSLRLAYFLPSFFALGLQLGWASFFIKNPLFKWLYVTAITLYLSTVLICSISRGFRLTFLVFWGIILTHIAYGLCFIKGLLSQRLKEE